MAIVHSVVKAPGQTLAAVADWNANHSINGNVNWGGFNITNIGNFDAVNGTITGTLMMGTAAAPSGAEAIKIQQAPGSGALLYVRSTGAGAGFAAERTDGGWIRAHAGGAPDANFFFKFGTVMNFTEATVGTNAYDGVMNPNQIFFSCNATGAAPILDLVVSQLAATSASFVLTSNDGTGQRNFLSVSGAQNIIQNRHANGVVQIRANTAVAGLGGEVTVATFQDDRVVFAQVLQPPTLADGAAPNNSIYYSSTQTKLVYKDAGGGVNNLY